MDQFQIICGILRVGGNPATNGATEPVVFMVDDLVPDNCPDPFGQDYRFILGGIGQKHHKFIAAVSCRDIAQALLVAQDSANTLKELVAAYQSLGKHNKVFDCKKEDIGSLYACVWNTFFLISVS